VMKTEDLPHEEQDSGEKLKEMVVQYDLNAVLQQAVNAAFVAGSTDPVAFMGQFLVERKDRVPSIEKVVARPILAADETSTMEVDIYCKVNGIVKMFSRVALPSLASFTPPAPPAPEEGADGGGEEAQDTPPVLQPKTAQELCAAIEAAVAGMASQNLDVRSIELCDETVLTALGSCVSEAELFKAATLGVSLAIAEAGAALQCFFGPREILPFEHIACEVCGHQQDVPYAMPSLMMPIFANGALGVGGHISIVPARKFSFSDAFALGSKIHKHLKEVLAEKEMDVTMNYDGAFAPVAPAPPDPKAKAPPPPESTIEASIALLEAAMTAAEVTIEDVQFAVAPSGGANCEVTEEEVEPEEGAEPLEEGQEPEKVTVYTYSYGEPKRTPEAVEMYVGLLDRGVRILVDPLHLEDPGLPTLAAALVEKSPDFVLAGNLMFNNDASLVSAAAAAAVDPDDGETRPWASCVNLDAYETGSVSRAAGLAKAMFNFKGRVMLQNGQPHVAVGLGVDYVRMGILSADRVPAYNEYRRIEQYLKEKKMLAP